MPALQGELSGELPLSRRPTSRNWHAAIAQFVLRGEGKTRVNKVPGYQVLYTTMAQGHELYGRNVLLLPEKPGVRRGREDRDADLLHGDLEGQGAAAKSPRRASC